MRRAPNEYDVAIVGASLGGCTAARLFAQRGLRVALVDRHSDPAAYKAVCTHFIQPSATPVIEKLGLAALLDERGANHNAVDLWTPYGGWIRTADDEPHGFNVTRRTLDPLLRGLAADTPGVDLELGWTAIALRGGDRPTGVVVCDRHGTERAISARLVVGADGRGSTVARLAGVRGRVRPHERFFYWAYWRGVRPATGRSKMWLLEPDCAYTFPMEDGLTVVLVGPAKRRLPEFRSDLEGAYRRMLAGLPDGPDLTDATRESKLLGKLDMPNVVRPAGRPGLALVGDAALACDPLWGVGCGWALQSADWLVDATAGALAAGDERRVDAALARYGRTHLRRLGPHHLMISGLAGGRPASAFERMLYRASARDRKVVRAFAEVGSRRRSPATVLRPATLARVLLSGRGPRAVPG